MIFQEYNISKIKSANLALYSRTMLEAEAKTRNLRNTPRTKTSPEQSKYLGFFLG